MKKIIALVMVIVVILMTVGCEHEKTYTNTLTEVSIKDICEITYK